MGTGCHCQGPGQYVVPQSSELRCHMAFSVSVNFSVYLSQAACHWSRVLPALQDHLLSRDADELNHTCSFCAVTCTGCRARDVGTCPRGHPSAPGRERSQHGPGRPGPRPPARPPTPHLSPHSPSGHHTSTPVTTTCPGSVLSQSGRVQACLTATPGTRAPRPPLRLVHPTAP